MQSAEDIIKEHFGLKEHVMSLAPIIQQAAKEIIACYQRKGKVLICGNGGSASDSQHFAAELVGRFEKERKGLPAIALTTDSSILTSIANDFGFEHIFEKQVEAFAREGDILVAITTSGNSQNIISAVEKAKQLKLRTIALNGRDGGKLKGKPDIEVLVKEKNTARIQECHILIIHSICKLVEDGLR